MEAQRHSHGLMDPSTKVSHTVIPQRFIAMAANDIKKEVSPLQNTKVAAVLRENKVDSTGVGTRSWLNALITIKLSRPPN